MRTLCISTTIACLILGASAEDLTELAERQNDFDETLRRKQVEIADAKRAGDKAAEAKLTAFCSSIQDLRDRNTLEITKIIIKKRKEAGQEIEAGSVIDALNTLESSIATLKEALRVAQEEKMGPDVVNEARVALATTEASHARLQEGALWEAVYLDCYAMMEQRFPETKEPESDFSKRLEAELEKIDEATLEDPRHLLRLAEKVDELLSEERIKEKFKDSKLRPPNQIQRNFETPEEDGDTAE